MLYPLTVKLATIGRVAPDPGSHSFAVLEKARYEVA